MAEAEFSFEKTEYQGELVVVRNLRAVFEDGSELIEDLVVAPAPHAEEEDPDNWSTRRDAYVMRKVKERAADMLAAHVAGQKGIEFQPPHEIGSSFTMTAEEAAVLMALSEK